jgi:hypothetical protein
VDAFIRATLMAVPGARKKKLKETWGITCDAEVILPDVNLSAFCEALTKHVS